MSKIVQWKRGNANVTSTYTGFEGEITVTTDDWSLRVHDGITQGGHPISGGGSSTGNLAISNQTIAGTVPGDSIYISPLANGAVVLGNIEIVDTEIHNVNTAAGFDLFSSNGTIRVLSQSTTFGLDRGIGIVRQIDSNLAVITSANRGNGNIGIRITSNVSRVGIDLPSDGSIGIGAVANPGYDVTTGGSLYAREFYAAANFPTGYQFTTADGDTGFSHAYQADINGNVSLVRIKHGGETTARFYDNLTTTLSGNLVVSQNNNFGVFPNAFVQIYSGIDSYSQVVHQNLNDGVASTTDFVVTADVGTDTTDYLDVGIAGSGYNNALPFNRLGTSIDQLDGYIYVQGNANSSIGGNLTIGTTILGKITKILAGGVDAANVVAVFSNVGILPGANVSHSLGSRELQWKDLWVSNNTIYIGGVPLSVNSDGNLTVNGNVISGTGNVNFGNFIFSGNYLYNLNGGSFNNGDLSHGSTASLNLPENGLTSSISLQNTYGNITLGSGSNAAITSNWIFDNTGNLILPSEGNIVGITPNNAGRIQWLGNSSGDGFGYTTLGLIPDDTLISSDQYLIIDPTAPGHIHIRAGGTQDNSNADLFLGGENSYFKVAAGTNSQTQISANSHSWTFGVDGTFTLPTDAGLNGSQINSISNSSGDLNGYTTLQLIPDVTLGTGSDQYLIIDPTAPGHIHIRAGGTQDNSSADLILGGEYSHVRIPAGANSTVYIKSNDYNWQFGTDGTLTLPGSLSTPSNVTVNDTLFVVGSIQPTGASPAPYLRGFSSISTVISGNPNEGNITAHNYLIANGGIITTGNITGGNLSVTGNISAQYFAGNGSLLTGVDAENSATIDILNTNGLSTVFYPTFVEDRTNGQILRADVDLTYRTDDNILTVQNISSSGNISAAYFIGNGALLTGISAGSGNYGNSNVSTFLASFGSNSIVTTGNITGGNLSVTGNIIGNVDGFTIGYRDIPQVTFTSNATLALTDAGKHYFSSNSANVITVPNNATVSFNIGAAISIVQQGTGNLTISPAGGVTMYLAGNSTSSSRLLGNYGMATLMKVGTDTWFINGTGLT